MLATVSGLRYTCTENSVQKNSESSVKTKEKKMAQPIAPEVWQEGINDPRFLPGRKTRGMFTGNGIKGIANNGEACRVWDINISDYITDYDDRRINGHKGTNTDGHDGWGASAWGVFQDVRFSSRVYTMGRHRSTALRVFDEMQYAGPIGTWGDTTKSNVITNGQALMKTAAIISKAKDLWQKEVLDPDVDKYNLFAVLSGHISGRLVGNSAQYNDQIFDGNAAHYKWVAQPGSEEGSALPPRFAPIHGIKWDDENVAQMLQNIKVTWNNLNIPTDNRVIYLDQFYEINLMRALTGAGIPATEAAYSDVKEGTFTRLMGWDFDFSIPENYWPKLYFDNNLNVCHGTAENPEAETGYTALGNVDKFINSIAGTEGNTKLLEELIAADRMSQLNFVRTTWNGTKFVKTIRNYPLGQPWADGFYDQSSEIVATGDAGAATGAGNTTLNGFDSEFASPTTYPFTEPGGGYGLKQSQVAVPATGYDGTPTLQKVIGLALYRPSAQLSQEYSDMRTEDGGTRGKFTEMVFDVKYDAWVIEQYAAGILPIIKGEASSPAFGLPVSIVSNVAAATTSPGK